MDWKKELTDLSQIEDPTTRQEAITAWWGTLPETEKDNILDTFHSMVTVAEVLWRDLSETLGEMWEVIQKPIVALWDTPEVQAYAALLDERYKNSLPIPEIQDGAAASSE